MINWEDTFTSWSQGPSKTEQEKCVNAEVAVRKAIATHARLNSMDIDVFAQGSYENRTNVRQDSDVDICARLDHPFFADYPKGKTRDDFGNVEGSITFSEFKNLVGEALVAYFGAASVERGNKAFGIHENTYRVDSDVLPAMEFRKYFEHGSMPEYRTGIAFIPDNISTKITNYPEQNLENGKRKHEETARRFKKIIRILKCLRNRMQDENIPATKDIASCLIEHLVWNVPSDKFARNTLTADVRNVLAHVFNNTMNDKDCKKWCEVNGIKFLFHAQQPWTRQQAHDFISATWDYLGFE